MLHAVLRSTRFANLAAVILSIGACTGSASRLDGYMTRGQEYFAAENYSKARVEFGNALQINPKSAEARYMSGRVAEKLGKIRDAVGAYQAAIENNPEHIQARASLGRVFVFAGVPDQAMETVEPALAKHPDDPDLLTVRGAARIQLKDKDGALADAEHAVKVAPDNENAIALLASLYRQSPEPSRAIDLLKRSLEKLPKSVDLRQVLASLYLGSGAPELAEAQLEEIIKLKSNVAAHRLQLALVYTRDKKLDEADGVLQAGVKQLPDDRQMKLAYVDFLTGQRSKAAGEKALRDFIAKNPKDFELQIALGAFQERTGDPKAALITYQQVVKGSGDMPEGLTARTRMAAQQLRDGRPDEARRLIDEVITRNPRDNDALILRGNLELDSKEPTKAIADLRAVLRDQPEAVGVMRVLARAHLANGEPALAEEQLRKAMALAPKDVSIRVELAQLLAQTQRADQAIPMVEEAVTAAPSDSGIRESLTRLYIGTNQLDRARSAAEDLKTLRPDLAVGYYLAGIVAAGQKRAADAEKNLERALELQPTAMDALAGLTRLDLSAGKQAVATARLKAIVEKDPKNAPTRNLLGELYLAGKDVAAAQPQFDAAIQVAPKWWIPYRNLGLLALSQNDFAAAIAVYEKGVTATDQEIALVTDLAALYEQQRRPDDAIEAYESLLAKNPKNETAANNLAMLLVSYRKDAKSVDRARDLTASFSSTNKGALLDTFGWVRFKRGDQSEGLSALERAVELMPDSKVVRYHLGMAQLQAGQRDKARLSLKQAVEGKQGYAGVDEARAALASLDRQAG